MVRFFSAVLLLFASLAVADEPSMYKLAAPRDWSGETISLPPGFARDMSLKGTEHIRFAPGMMKPMSDTFFSYAFVFELQAQPALTDATVKNEFLKYYRGLFKAVVKDALPDVDPTKFTLELKSTSAANLSPTAQPTEPAKTPYAGTLDWVEPFATKKLQRLHLEIWTWNKNDRNYLFACVSPQSPDSPIWRQLHQIRDDYWKK